MDLRTGLSWAPSPKQPATPSDKNPGCPPGFRLPTRTELLSLVGADGDLRRLARVTSPPRGLLLSSEVSDEKTKAPWGLDLISGSIVTSDGNNGYQRCVSEKKNEGRAPGGVVHFSLAGDQLWYIVQHGAREEEGTVPLKDLCSPETAMRLSLSGLEGIQGAIDVEVESGVDFGHATWVLGVMTRKGITPRKIMAEAPPLRRARR